MTIRSISPLRRGGDENIMVAKRPQPICCEAIESIAAALGVRAERGKAVRRSDQFARRRRDRLGAVAAN